MNKLQNAVQMISRSSKNATLRSPARDAKRSVSKEPKRAPHPIPAGKEGQVCPITGLSADGIQKLEVFTATSLAELEADPDIVDENMVYMNGTSESRKPSQSQKPPMVSVEQRSEPIAHVAVLNVFDGAHKATDDTRYLVRSIGGLPTLRKFTTIFYKRAFADVHIDKFIRSHADPHGERFATWIAEKFGDGTLWTEERKSRPRDVMDFGSQTRLVAYDRSSAHFAAWHSPKREAHKWGQHFTPDDARVWMRLHFWAAREAGLFEPQHAAFMDYYIRFIAHFVSVYSSRSPPFTRESARWSANPRNIEVYLASGNYMSDVIDQPLEDALAQLPRDERVYTGSRHHKLSWPYGGPHEITHLG